MVAKTENPVAIDKETVSEHTKRSFWSDLKDSKEFSLYYPNRFEYFCGRALQGLITGRSEKDIRKAVRRAIELGVEMEQALDTEKDN